MSGGSWLAFLGGVFRGWDQPSRLVFENEYVVLVVETAGSILVLFNGELKLQLLRIQEQTYNIKREKNLFTAMQREYLSVDISFLFSMRCSPLSSQLSPRQIRYGKKKQKNSF